MFWKSGQKLWKERRRGNLHLVMRHAEEIRQEGIRVEKWSRIVAGNAVGARGTL